VILRLALRSLATRPVRTAVLACGFGFGIAVMAALLGVGDVILEQAHSPALDGGGDIVISGRFGALENARFLIASVLGSPDVAAQAAGVAPWKKTTLYMLKDGQATAVTVTGSLPAGDRAVGNREVEHVSNWSETADDRLWSTPDKFDVLRTMDRFHPVPDRPEFAASWAEWLYFNGRSADGRLRFYLTFMVGPAAEPGRRLAGVRLQFDRDGQTSSYAAGGSVDEATVLASAPDLEIAGNRVRLEGGRYTITLALPGASGTLTLDAALGQSLPPATISGARGWITGYTAPVLSGRINGTLTLGHDKAVFDNASGYHDHNWGFWKGVRWQWGQVANRDLSFVYGRIFPPPDVADPDRVPGFLGVLGAKGALGFSTSVSLEETNNDHGTPEQVTVRARGLALDLELVFTIDRTVRSPMSMTAGPTGSPMNFLQLGGEYRVKGKVGERAVDFTARGAAETFR
jgi:hypothetical protein